MFSHVPWSMFLSSDLKRNCFQQSRRWSFADGFRLENDGHLPQLHIWSKNQWARQLAGDLNKNIIGINLPQNCFQIWLYIYIYTVYIIYLSCIAPKFIFPKVVSGETVSFFQIWVYIFRALSTVKCRQKVLDPWDEGEREKPTFIP